MASANKAKANDAACDNCGRPERELKACGRCKLTRYCSKECQVAHWKTGHKRFCEPTEDRKPSSNSLELDATIDGKNAEKCGVCLEWLNKSLVEILPCSHAFHVQCIDDIRSYGLTMSCPFCRAKLPQKTSKKTSDIEALLQRSKKNVKSLNTVRQLMIDAVLNGDIDVLKLLQKHGINVNMALKVETKHQLIFIMVKNRSSKI